MGFCWGVLFGLGAAVTVGPIFIDMMRRTLSFNGWNGFSLGFGACLVDFTYALLALVGSLFLFRYAFLGFSITVIGSLILGYLGLKTLQNTGQLLKQIAAREHQRLQKGSLWKTVLLGYVMTAFSPLTVIFWISVSSQLLIVSHKYHSTPLSIAAGVFLGALCWCIGFNFTLHQIRHKLSVNIIKNLNRGGGIFLIGFALFGLIKGIIHFY
jgi:threonine/homoserine/homoserine lactone efflux protein